MVLDGRWAFGWGGVGWARAGLIGKRCVGNGRVAGEGPRGGRGRVRKEQKDVSRQDSQVVSSLSLSLSLSLTDNKFALYRGLECV